MEHEWFVYHHPPLHMHSLQLTCSSDQRCIQPQETLIKPLAFAEILCDDLHIPPHPHFAPAITRQIEDQIQDFMYLPQHSSGRAENNDGNDDEVFLPRDAKGNIKLGPILDEQD